MKNERRRTFSWSLKGTPESHFIILESFLMVFLMAYLLYLIFSTINGVIDSLPSNQQAELGAIFDRISYLLLVRVSILFIVVSLFNFLLGLYYLHRITGPLGRIKGILDEVAAGKIPSHDTTLRKKDYLQELAESLNNAIRRIRESRK
jgi:methyl-accepting chemotaxis protein